MSKCEAYVPFLAEEISEPDPGLRAIRMLDVLPEWAAQAYRDPVRLFVPAEELPGTHGERCRAFTQVLGDRDQWVRYLHRPIAQELWHLARLTKLWPQYRSLLCLRSQGRCPASGR